MKTPAPRKLIVPAPQPFPHPEPQPPAPAEPPPACVAPRRRFVLRFLAVCGGLTLAGILIHGALFPTEFTELGEPVWGYIGSMILWGLFPFALLCIPARTKRGSFLQLLCLIIPLFITLSAVSLCWARPRGLYEGMDMGLAIVIANITGLLYVYLPVAVLHLLICIIEKLRRTV